MFFGLQFVNRTIILPKDYLNSRPDGGGVDHVHMITCGTLGTVSCLICRQYQNITETKTCEGIVKIDGVAHSCEGPALFPGKPNQQRTGDKIARCMSTRNINVSHTRWVLLRHQYKILMRDAIDAVHGAGL